MTSVTMMVKEVTVDEGFKTTRIMLVEGCVEESATPPYDADVEPVNDEWVGKCSSRNVLDMELVKVICHVYVATWFIWVLDGLTNSRERSPSPIFTSK